MAIKKQKYLSIVVARKQIAKFIKPFITNNRPIQIVGPTKSDLIAATTLFVDGGSRHQSHLNKKFKRLTVGDGDSGPIIPEIFVKPEKNISDLRLCLDGIFLALKHHTSKRKKRIHVFATGFLGERKDHELINLGEFYNFIKRCTNLGFHVSVSIDDNIRILPHGISSISITGTFSLIAFAKTKIRLQGKIKYPFAGSLRPFDSLGLSNRSHGRFRLVSSNPIMMITNTKNRTP